MLMLRPLPLALLAAAACTMPGYDGFTSFEEPDPAATSTTAAVPPPGGIQTVTGPDPTTTTTPATTDPETTTTGEPLPPPPVLGDIVLTPNPITEPGTITVKVLASHADGVRMTVDDGPPTELTLTPDGYLGEIKITTGLSFGPHHATLVAWRDDLETLPQKVDFDVALPPPGQPYVWESGNLIGTGNAAALAPLPMPVDGRVLVEFGTHYDNGKPRCYLRRRDPLGAWSASDLVEIQPGIECQAVDLGIKPDGTIYLLALRNTGNDPRWWLGRIASWNLAATPENLALGGSGDRGLALAVTADNVAVCGTHPTQNPQDTIDAAVWRIGQLPKFYDHVTDQIEPHWLGETLRDCTFDGPTLIAVGDAYGRHDPNAVLNRRRHLQLRLDLDSDTFTAAVGAELGAATQSAANALALLDGQMATVGYQCGDTCKQDPYLWVHADDGTLEWYAALGPGLAATDITISPAGYLVLCGAQIPAPWSSNFWMAAYFVGDYEPVWSFTHDDAPALGHAAAVAIGPAGHIYGAGAGKGNFPAVVYITP